ncbi:LON domain-containing protein [Rhizoctonia solani AG-1 IA]|uniref:LON domain-containing protein n=1 Tax=Thanatephorus cucumeris (strain AG1-IA) TaxID=983506 RepID=L8X9S8_THACA|nr:LON domain-containing protein [Rhizoctonia solani AG-1 IA]
MAGSDEEEHERGERGKGRAREAPPRNGTPPVTGDDTRDHGTSCEQNKSEETPKPDNSQTNTRSMAVPPKTARVCPSDAPRETHMGATSPPAPPAPSLPSSTIMPHSPDHSHLPLPPSTPPPTAPTPMPTTTTAPATMPTPTPTPPRPSALLPLLRCALCRLLVEAPTTLNCGHTLCSKHMTPEKEEQPGPSMSAQRPCPVEGCRPRQPNRVRVLGRPSELDSHPGVTFTPAHSALSDSPSPLRGRVVKLDVTVSKLLEVITNAARQSTATAPAPAPTSDRHRHRHHSTTPDDESTAPIDPRPQTVHPRSSPPDPTPDDSDSDSSSQSPPRPRKKLRTHPPAHTSTGIPDPPSTPSFEKELLNELTCEICFMLLCNPITTPCQHHAHNEVITQIIAKAFPTLLEERVAAAETDGRDSRLDTPIFVCQLSYPGMPTLLHFFEPRYRLMLRRCLASATPRFGMVMPRQNANNTDGNDYGTMLEIKNVQMLSDGRSMVETYGTFRFRILERGTLDGYLVGRTERIDDYPPEVEAEIERIALMNPSEGDITLRGIERSNQELVNICRRFLDQLRNGTAPWVVQRLNNTYGPMPADVASFGFWVLFTGSNNSTTTGGFRQGALLVKTLVGSQPLKPRSPAPLTLAYTGRGASFNFFGDDLFKNFWDGRVKAFLGINV